MARPPSYTYETKNELAHILPADEKLLRTELASMLGTGLGIVEGIQKLSIPTTELKCTSTTTAMFNIWRTPIQKRRAITTTAPMTLSAGRISPRISTRYRKLPSTI